MTRGREESKISNNWWRHLWTALCCFAYPPTCPPNNESCWDHKLILHSTRVSSLKKCTCTVLALKDFFLCWIEHKLKNCSCKMTILPIFSPINWPTLYVNLIFLPAQTRELFWFPSSWFSRKLSNNLRILCMQNDIVHNNCTFWQLNLQKQL